LEVRESRTRERVERMPIAARVVGEVDVVVGKLERGDGANALQIDGRKRQTAAVNGTQDDRIRNFIFANC